MISAVREPLYQVSDQRCESRLNISIPIIHSSLIENIFLWYPIIWYHCDTNIDARTKFPLFL